MPEGYTHVRTARRAARAARWFGVPVLATE